MNRLLITFLLTLSFQVVFADQIPPQTLRKLITYSEYIIIATIDNPMKTKKIFDKSTNDSIEVIIVGEDEADLHIKEILKGNPDNKELIVVSYESGMICPASPYYPDKEIVIAFLGKNDSSKTYYTEALSYGTKVMNSEDELNSYRVRILEYLEILKLNNQQEKESEIVEWLVKCTENKYTRWDGVFELSKEAHKYIDPVYYKEEYFYKKLNKTQKIRIDSVFFATDTIGFNEIGLADLVSPSNYPKLKQHLIKLLTSSDDRIVMAIMRKIIEIAPNNELQQMYEELYSMNSVQREAKQKIIIDNFIEVATKK